MAVKTYLEQLESVQTTIEKIETSGQAYGIGGRSLTRADLGVLYDREERLRTLVNKETRGTTGARVRYVEVG